MANWKALVLVASGVSVGFLLLLLACALPRDWWPMITLLPYAMIPVPFLLCGQIDANLVDESGWKIVGDFITGVLAVSVFAIPAVMAHVNAIDWLGLLLATLANIVIFATAVGYTIWKIRSPEAAYSST